MDDTIDIDVGCPKSKFKATGDSSRKRRIKNLKQYIDQKFKDKKTPVSTSNMWKFLDNLPDVRDFNMSNFGFNFNGPPLSLSDIEKFPDKPWDWGCLSEQTSKEKELFYEKYYRIYMATFRLQRYFNRMYDDPEYLFCRNRLDKLFSE